MRDSSDSKPKSNSRSRDAISPDVEKPTQAAHCTNCGKPLNLGDNCGRTLFGVICETCADDANACKHESGTVTQHYDSDGCGFRVWNCDRCAFATTDQE